MGIRSYLLVSNGENHCQLLEANNVLPLLWLCAFTLADAGEGLAESGPTLRLTEGAAYGMAVDGKAAIANLKRRQETLLPWLSKEAGKIYKQFSKFIAAQKAQHLRLDLAEWVEASNSVEEASGELRAIIAALNTPPPKTLPPSRIPKAIKWLLEYYDFASLNKNLPSLANSLGGRSATICEPWRREPARDRRLPDDFLRWSNSDPNVSPNGQTVVVKVKNAAHLETAIIWSPAANSCIALPVDDAIEHMHVNLISGNGRVLFGTGTSHPGPVSFAFRYDGGILATCSDEARPSALVCASSDDGAVAVGFMSSGKYDDSSERAFLWRANHDPLCFLDAGVTSEARHITPDGRYIAGTLTVSDGSGGQLMRAFVWSEAGGLTVVCEDRRATWIALGPDGDCGVLQTLNAPRGAGNNMYWRKGEALRPILNADGEPLSAIRISAAADAVLGDYPDEKGAAGSLVLWRPDRPVQTIALPSAGVLRPQFVGNGGAAAIVAVYGNESHCPREMLVWSEQGGILRHPMEHRGAPVTGGIWARNRSPTLEQFVAAGQSRYPDPPYIWTAGGGVQLCPADLELARQQPKV